MEKDELIQLISQIQNGDLEAIGILFGQYKDMAYGIAMRETRSKSLSDDIVQEAFLEVIQKIGDLKNPTAFPAWLKEITYHQCTRYYRKKENVHEVAANEAEDGYSVFGELEEENAAFLPDEALEQKELRAAILGMVEELPDVQRSALYMFYYDELPLKAIAQAQGVSVNTANTRLNRGRKAVKDSIERYEKKNGLQLHSVAFLPLFRWLLSEGEATMPLDSAASVAQQITTQTGVTIAGNAVASTAAGISAKIAGIPLAAKIISGLAAAALLLGIPAVLRMTNSPEPAVLKSTTAAASTPETIPPSEAAPFDPLRYYAPVLEQYKDALENNLYMDPDTGYWQEGYVLGEYINILIPAESRAYTNYGGSLEEDFQVYYAFRDLNGDGIDEMFIGAGTSVENARVFDLIIANGTQPERMVIDASIGERSQLIVLSDGSFWILSSGGATYHADSHFQLLENNTLRYLSGYEQDNSDYYRITGSESKESITGSEYQEEIKALSVDKVDLAWKLILGDNPIGNDASETTTPVAETRDNLIDGLTPEHQKKLNIFLSNFAEQGFHDYPAETDLQLLHFAWTYCYLNTNHVKDAESNTRCLSASAVDQALNRFFGTTIEHRTMGIYEYRDGYYYMPAADGEFYGYCAIAREMYQNKDGTYEVAYDVYRAKWYWEDYVMYYDDVSPYYSLSPDQLSEYPELEFQYTGTSVLRDYTRRNGEESYQVITLD